MPLNFRSEEGLCIVRTLGKHLPQRRLVMVRVKFPNYATLCRLRKYINIVLNYHPLFLLYSHRYSFYILEPIGNKSVLYNLILQKPFWLNLKMVLLFAILEEEKSEITLSYWQSDVLTCGLVNLSK